MAENTEELTVQDILDEANEVGYHTILEVWREVLRPAQRERFKKITPQWANRICSAYREVVFADMPAFRDSYFDKVNELAEILDLEIAEDAECLNIFTPEEDVEHNGMHYLNVLITWQRAFLAWELDWECTEPDAAVDLAAISEVHRMFFDNTGLTSLLDNINFELTDTDRDILAAALQELKAATEEQ
jgi:hypothetical protein